MWSQAPRASGRDGGALSPDLEESRLSASNLLLHLVASETPDIGPAAIVLPLCVRLAVRGASVTTE